MGCLGELIGNHEWTGVWGPESRWFVLGNNLWDWVFLERNNPGWIALLDNRPLLSNSGLLGSNANRPAVHKYAPP